MTAALRIALVHGCHASGASPGVASGASPGAACEATYGTMPRGDIAALFDQERVLRAAGHEVIVLAVRTDELGGAEPPSGAAGGPVGGRGAGLADALREFAPDVVHVLNFAPESGSSWFGQCPTPLVVTLHDCHPLRAADPLHRDGTPYAPCTPDTRCHGAGPAMLPFTQAGRGPAVAGETLLNRADRLVVLSALSRRAYEAAGVPGGRLALVPHFVTDAPRVNSPMGKGRWLFAGGLCAEEGIVALLRRWPDGEPLDVVGDGEQRDECRAAAPASVRFLGGLGRDVLRRALPSWRGLVLPSRRAESTPLVYAETLAAGLPVLAFEGSSVAEAVRAQGAGAVTSWSAPLAPVLREAATRFPALRAHCARVFAERYGEEVWLRRTQELYAAAGARPGGGRTADPARRVPRGESRTPGPGRRVLSGER